MVLILVLGALFGAIIQYANLNKFNTISGLAILEDLSVVKAISLAIGLGIVLLNIEISMGLAVYHVKPFMVGGLIIGGLVFGSGMAVLGYCPGTLAISLGQGSIDAFIGIIGGLLGGIAYTLVLPFISPVFGPDLGVLSLSTSIESSTIYYIVSTIVAVVFVIAAFLMHKVDKVKDKKWIIAGIALAILNAVILLSNVGNRPIGASTAFPYLADLLVGLTDNTYYLKIMSAGNWELIFLFGAFLSALAISLIKKEFKLNLIYDNWKTYKGDSKNKRVVWAFIGGFVLIFGARIAGGCTSGHILSGGMQIAYSSLFFAVFTFAGLLITGKLFYKSKL